MSTRIENIRETDKSYVVDYSDSDRGRPVSVVYSKREWHEVAAHYGWGGLRPQDTVTHMGVSLQLADVLYGAVPAVRHIYH